MNADLHVHTRFSDGEHSPREVVEMAAREGLGAISVTDHDTLAGVEEAIEAGKGLGVEVVPGVEITFYHGQAEMHMLGYFVDLSTDPLTERFRARRRERFVEMMEKLRRVGVELPVEELVRASGNSPGRAHLARALVEDGHARTVERAFQKYLSQGRPGYAEKIKLSPEEAVELVGEMKGVAALAHPGLTPHDEVIPRLRELGMAASEVRYARHSPHNVAHYSSIARKHGLVETGGSDFHGLRLKNVRLGEATVEMGVVRELESLSLAAKER